MRGLSSYQVAQTSQFMGVCFGLLFSHRGCFLHTLTHIEIMNGERGVPMCVLEDSGVSCGCDCVGVRRTYQLDRADRSWDSPSSHDQRHKQHRQLPENLHKIKEKVLFNFGFYLKC